MGDFREGKGGLEIPVRKGGIRPEFKILSLKKLSTYEEGIQTVHCKINSLKANLVDFCRDEKTKSAVVWSTIVD